MMKTRIIAVSNQKGGVGKTTTVHNLGAGLAREGNRVLLVDLDPQGNLSTAMFSAGRSGGNAYDMIITRSMLDKKGWTVVWGTKINKLGLVLSSPKLAHIDIELSGVLGSEYNLREALLSGHTFTDYDYILLDTPPALGKLTVNALTAAGELIIPVQADMFSLQGFAQIRETVEVVRRYSNKELKITGLLLTRHKKTVLSREIEELLEKVAEECETKLFKARIADRVAIKEAQMKQKDIFSYKPRCAAAIDYRELVREVMADA